MVTTTSRIFANGDGEAIILPPEVAFGLDVELTLVRSGDVLTIYPAGISTAELVACLNALPRPASVEVRDEEP